MHLRIGDPSKTLPVPVSGLRSIRLKPARGRWQYVRAGVPRLLIFWIFAVILGLSFHPAAQASPGSSATITNPSAWSLAQSDPRALVREAVENEFNNSYGHRDPVRYLFRKKTRNLDTTKEIVETANGGVARLVAIHNRPLTATENHAEVERLRQLIADPAEQQHRSRGEQRDAERIAGIMHLLPDAFLNQFAGSVQTASGPVIRLTFTPNPHFSPPTLESRILTGIRGEIWIDPTDLRVVRIEGHLFRTVEYGWGILGTLYPGGTISIEQAKTPQCGWQLAHLNLNMAGKELILKSLNIVVDETATDYHFVPKGWKYTDAIDWLLKMPAGKPAPAQSTEP